VISFFVIVDDIAESRGCATGTCKANGDSMANRLIDNHKALKIKSVICMITSGLQTVRAEVGAITVTRGKPTMHLSGVRQARITNAGIMIIFITLCFLPRPGRARNHANPLADSMKEFHEGISHLMPALMLVSHLTW
jgi:hypothetical protein